MIKHHVNSDAKIEFEYSKLQFSNSVLDSDFTNMKLDSDNLRFASHTIPSPVFFEKLS